MKIAKPLPATELDEKTIGAVAEDLKRLQDYITTQIGPDAYVSVSATVEGADGNLTTIGVTHVDPTEEEPEVEVEVE